jgi:hypothetical protein
VKGKDEDIPCGQIDKRADIKAQAEITDYGKQVTAKRKKNELVEPDNLLSLGRSIGFI